MHTRSKVRLAQNQLKRPRGVTLEDRPPHPSSRAGMERETSITSNTDTMNGSKKRAVVQTPHVAPTGHDQRATEIEESPAENLLSQIKALECENQSLKEEMEEHKKNYYHKRYEMTKDFVLRNGALEAVLKQKSGDLEEQLKVTKNLASCYGYEIRSLRAELDQKIQETRKYFEGRLKTMEICEIRSLKEKLKDSQTQNDQEIQEFRESAGRLNIMEDRNEVMARENTLLKERLEATQNLKERLRAAEDHAQKQDRAFHQEVQKSRELEERLRAAEDHAQKRDRAFHQAVQRRRELEQYEAFIQEEEHKAFLRLKQETEEHLAQNYRELEEQLEFAKELITHNDSTTHEILSLQERLETAVEQNSRSHQELRKLYEKQSILESKIQSLTKELEAAQNGSSRVQNIREEQLIKPTTSLNRGSEYSAMNCHCMRCVIGLHCQATE